MATGTATAGVTPNALTVAVNFDRATIRCVHCKLNQFESPSGLCRKCRKPFEVAGGSEIADQHQHQPQSQPQSQPHISPTLTPLPVPTAFDHPLYWLPVVILYVRTRSGLSQSGVCQRWGYTKPWLSRIERGLIVPSAGTLSDLAEACGGSLVEVLRMCEWLANGE
jgi:ribosome-binding protein aMBF1 (putative translation factor)